MKKVFKIRKNGELIKNVRGRYERDGGKVRNILEAFLKMYNIKT